MEYSSNRKNTLLIGAGIIFLILLIRLFNIQIINEDYKINAENNALIYRTKYPVRGLIYDRNGNILVGNKNVYDIIVTPYEVRSFDTLELCKIFDLNIDDVRNTFIYYKKYRTRIGYQSQTFLKQVNTQQYSKFIEKAYKFPGFSGIPRTARNYPYNAGGNLLGYVSEVDADFLKNNPDYRSGDYIGRTGLEQGFESILKGEKGYNIFLRDAQNKIHSSYQNGEYDKPAKAGVDVISTIDAELQHYGELLMQNKVGSIVALEPSSGEILTMVSSPGIDVSVLGEINKHYNEFANNPYKPLYNRAVMSPYPPGSVFKMVNALIALQEGVITPYTSYNCYGAFREGSLSVGCHSHKHSTNLEESIATSCNTYYCYVLKSILQDPKYGRTSVAFDNWREKVESFGFGRKLGSDFPNEQAGILPSSELYDKKYNKRWNYLTVLSLSIGQGELGSTPLQLANLASIIANRGYYYTPHIFKSSVGDSVLLDKKYTKQNHTLIEPKHFRSVVNGMYRAVNETSNSDANAKIARVPGLDICGKTGTAENPHGEDHSIFICFAPRDNPKIAVAVYVEHGTWGARWAAPIASLIVEQYLNGKISEDRKELEQRMLNGKLINLR